MKELKGEFMIIQKINKYSDVEIMFKEQTLSVDFTAYCTGQDNSSKEFSEPEELLDVEIADNLVIYRDMGVDADMEKINLDDISMEDYILIKKELESWVYSKEFELDWTGADEVITDSFGRALIYNDD